MTLEEFLRQNEMSLAVFAKSCGTSASTILRARDGQVLPSRRTLAAIERATSGKVSAAEILAVAVAASTSLDRDRGEVHDGD